MPTKTEMTLHQIADAMEDSGFDWGLKVDVAYECAWGAELRVTPNPNNHGDVDVSTVFFAAGGSTAEEVAGRAYAGFQQWNRKRRKR